MSGVLDTIEAFWKAREKPDGYHKTSKYNKVVREGGKVTYSLWDNPIAVLEKNILTLRDCGWKTVTTKDRLQGILSCFYRTGGEKFGYMRVEQNRNIWYLLIGNERYQWSGGVEIDLTKPTARLKPVSKEKIAERSAEFAEKVSRFIKEFKRRVDNGTLAMDGGECWGISMGMQKCEECSSLGTTRCGGGIRLLVQAVGRGNPHWVGMYLADSEGKASLDKIRKNWKDISHDLRYWLKKKLMLREVERRKSVEERVTDKVQATASALGEIASGER